MKRMQQIPAARMPDIEDDAISMQAGAWLLDMQSPDVTDGQIAEWQQWLEADERHRQAYEDLQSVWQTVDRVAQPAWPGDADVQMDEYEPTQTVSAWRSRDLKSAREPSGRRYRVWAGGLAAAAAIAAIFFGTPLMQQFFTPDRLSIETRVGEDRELRLSDGSRMFVGPHSVLNVAITERARTVALERGEAYFEVAKDRTRPFQVRAGAAGVTAIGTAFNVRHMGGQVVVAVSEGVVEIAEDDKKGMMRLVTRRQLGAGQKLVLESAGHAPVVEAIAPKAVASWREGRLQFSGEPLADVVANVNRYASRPIEIEDPGIGQLRVTGTVSVGNIESWLKSLEKALPVQVVPDDRGTLRLTGR